MYIYDETDPSYFVAGLGPPNLAAVGVIITTYTDSEIVFTLGSCYGQNGWVFAPGDNFTMYVLGAQYSASVSYPTETSETDWSAPQNVDGSGEFTSVSCASSQFCAAVDIYGNVLTYNGSSWSAPDMITEGGILSVSCPSTTFCVSVGEGGGENTWNGSTWNGPGPVGTDEYNLNSVSCTSSDFCVAVDDNGGADTWNGANVDRTHRGRLRRRPDFGLMREFLILRRRRRRRQCLRVRRNELDERGQHRRGKHP